MKTWHQTQTPSLENIKGAQTFNHFKLEKATPFKYEKAQEYAVISEELIAEKAGTSAGKRRRLPENPAGLCQSLTKWSPLVFTGKHESCVLYECTQFSLNILFFLRGGGGRSRLYIQFGNFQVRQREWHTRSHYDIFPKETLDPPQFTCPTLPGASHSRAEPGILDVSKSFTPSWSDTFTGN